MIDEKHFRALFDLAVDAMFVTDPGGRIREANQAAAERLGTAKAEILGRRIADFLEPGSTASLQNGFAALEQGCPSGEAALVHTDGSALPVEICNRAIELDGERVFLAVVRDISARKRAESESRQNAEKWRLLFENMTTGFALHEVILDAQGRCVDYRFLEANPAYEQLTGLKASALIGRTVLEVLPDTEPYWIDIFGNVALSGEPTLYENYSKELGRWYRVWVFSPKSGQFAVIVADVTEQKEAGEALAAALEFSNSLIESMQDGFSVLDKDGRPTAANPALCRMTGFSREELVGSGVPFPYWPPEERAAIQAAFDKTLRGEIGNFELTFMHKSGRRFPVIVSPSIVRDRKGDIVSYIATVKDVSTLKRVEATVQLKQAELREAQRIAHVGSWRLDLATDEVTWSDELYRMLDLDPALPPPNYAEHQRLFTPESWERLSRALSRTKESAVPYELELEMIRTDGTHGWMLARGEVLRDERNAVIGLHGVAMDITERKLAAARIEHLAYHDQLTLLPNRLLLLDRLNQALMSTSRVGHAAALLFIDLDNFKSLNDTCGHDVGDKLLKVVAHRLVSCVREGDTVARLGGDEFVVMLLDLSEQALDAAAQAEAIGEKILAALRQPYRLDAHSYRSTASIGVTLFSGGQHGSDELMKQADIAMYQAKSSGRDTLRFFDPQMQSSITARVSLEGELRRALESGQFRLHYQVQVDHSHRPIGAEALIRWQHPERGLILPAHFIALAEETGLIQPIGQWVLEEACAQIARWQHALPTRELVLAVNVSATQFHQADFVDRVRTAVQKNRIDPARLKLELTESLLLRDIDDTIATMSALNEIGVQFSLDDFGTGYSSLQYLRRLPLDQLKIDRSFVHDIATDGSAETIVHTIIAMASSLSLDVIAEGVETEEQRQRLLKNGCAHFQGYLFGTPQPIAAFERLLARLTPEAPASS
jgi:diguanylate cyclase (GGDEF)-like protein/PAS domain S-box-containing protein